MVILSYISFCTIFIVSLGILIHFTDAFIISSRILPPYKTLNPPLFKLQLSIHYIHIQENLISVIIFISFVKRHFIQLNRRRIFLFTLTFTVSCYSIIPDILGFLSTSFLFYFKNFFMILLYLLATNPLSFPSSENIYFHFHS